MERGARKAGEGEVKKLVSLYISATVVWIDSDRDIVERMTEYPTVLRESLNNCLAQPNCIV